MSSRKQCRAPTAHPLAEATTIPAPALPSDLVLEIVARSDAPTLVRCAACCEPLRRDILGPAFIRRVCRGPGAVVPPRLLCFLQSIAMPVGYRTSTPPASFSMAHPATPAAASLSEKHLAPSMPGGAAADLLSGYDPVTSRGGLIVLRRRPHTDVPQESGICVYDPITGDRSFLPDPPEMLNYTTSYSYHYSYVLLTASDGIGCSFLLLAADFTMLYTAGSITVLTVSSDAAGDKKWSPITSAACHRRSQGTSLHRYCSAVVLGGAVHWVMHSYRWTDQFHILTYNIRTATAGSINKLQMNRLPERYKDSCDPDIRLASSPDGRLTMIVRDTLRMYVWLLSAGGSWKQHTVIDMEAAALRSQNRQR